MKRKYSIGFFAGMLCFVLLLSGAYAYNYQKALEKYQVSLAESAKKLEEQKALTIAADGTARKETGYYLKERHGFVIVYLADEQTIYTDTNIRLDSLPLEVQSEIQTGKYMEDTESLYGFLENYSS